MVAGNFAKILLSLDASAADSMLLQKLSHSLLFDILLYFLYKLNFLWYMICDDACPDEFFIKDDT